MSYDIGDHEVLGSEQAFDGRVIKVFTEQVRLPDGRTASWERVAHPGAVGMVPLLEDGTVLMLRQYRHAVRGVLLEIPAGKLDRGETPLECAVRELAEEVGRKAERMVELAEFYNSPGYSDERFYLYLATGLSSAHARAEEDEFLEQAPVHIEDAADLIASGVIRDAKSIIGLTMTRLYLAGEARQFEGEPF
ncbi:MAG: NUDIX hydrolase [Actinobacteria bacterium]|nr:NUDIX hydrolase [Actinomycetota bacterium]MBU1942382.1 NUDIX hydrolase [Actinomycetota bacterium]MBU2689266.1 NUDIX hydrolase [Actinomycetota bacterium]